MKRLCAFALALLFVGGATAYCQSATDTPALALVIVYDGSGSMKERVKGADGKKEQKFVIANNALVAIADKLQEFCDSKKTNIQAGLVVFTGGKASAPIPLANFEANRFKSWARSFKSPDGGTPLGEGIQQAARMLSQSKAAKKHILVVTDGESNVGPTPQRVLAQMKDDNQLIPTYFVAFDVEAKVFDPVKELGAMVVSASDEARLRVQLDTIVGKKILLEAE